MGETKGVWGVGRINEIRGGWGGCEWRNPSHRRRETERVLKDQKRSKRTIVTFSSVSGHWEKVSRSVRPRQ